MKLIMLTLALSAVYADLPPSCLKPIYCNSKLLHYVQMAQIFPESKTFIDLQLLMDEQVILSNFDSLLNQTSDLPSKDEITSFINEHFTIPVELEKWTPSDYNKNPPFLANISDYRLKSFGRDVNAIWPTLGRKVKAEVFENPDIYSLIPVHDGFIVPGGNLKDFYYWDTYWIVEGLLVSGMYQTAKGLISNLLELQRQFGHIPYGNRYYYQDRSQPPLLSAMMALYMRATNDIEFVKANIEVLEDELDYWLETHSVVFHVGEQEHTLLRYFSLSQGPRPEYYYKDFTLAQELKGEDAQTQFYIDIKSAAESGWEFSSRWFINEAGNNEGNITNIRTSAIIPVDLNAIFANALGNVAFFYSLFQSGHKGAHWAHLARQWKNSIKEVLWNDEDGIWYDYDLDNKYQRKYFYPSNVAPLWMRTVDEEFVKENGLKIFQYLQKTQSLQFPGGVPASLVRSGEDWDFPYSFPPLVSIMVNALEALYVEESSKLAFQTAQNYVRAAYKGFTSYKQLFDKYDVENPGKVGNGQQLSNVQVGYGWSNGVVISMLAKYGPSMTAQDYFSYNFYKNSYPSSSFPAYTKPIYPTVQKPLAA